MQAALCVLVFPDAIDLRSPPRFTPGHRVTNSQMPGVVVDNILSEHHFVANLAIRSQRAERLLPPHAGALICCCDQTAGAGFHHLEPDATYNDSSPPVFTVGLTTRNYEVGTEPVHRERHWQATVQIGQ